MPKFNKLIGTIFVLIFMALFGYDKPSNAQDSIIAKVLSAQNSIVHITALRSESRVSPNAAARIIPHTGKTIVARNIKTAELNKNGAGIIIHPSGYIITNLHTIKFAQKILVKLHNNAAFWAKVEHVVPEDDLALIKINSPAPLAVINFADSNQARIGEEIIHIGNSEFLNNTISSGRITGLARNQYHRLSDNIIVQLIQINLNLYEGDSGGPVLNKDGQLIGLVVAKHNKKEKTSFAIPANKIKLLCLDFLK